MAEFYIPPEVKTIWKEMEDYDWKDLIDIFDTNMSNAFRDTCDECLFQGDCEEDYSRKIQDGCPIAKLYYN